MSRNKGFTLLELLLVVAILAILVAAIGPQFVYSAKTNIEATRKARFAANYQSCMLAANMFLLASETRLIIRNSAYDTYFTPKASGLGLLTASSTLTMDTCTYENAAGETRYFGMLVSDGPGAPGNLQASVSIKLLTALSGGNIIDPITGTAGASGDPVENALATAPLSLIWERIKDK